jgi:predicted GNAT superfamily acetyltransferase
VSTTLPGMEVAVDVRPARTDELVAGTELLARALRFSPRDAMPPWLVKDAQEFGAVALAALADRRLVGFSLALPGSGPEGPYLFSCGLAVDRRLRGNGIGRRLKLAQREIALERGYRVIRWRADPLNSAGLGLYLNGLGARLVGYRAELYAGVRDTGDLPHDDVDVEWTLDGDDSAAGEAVRRVEVPYEGARLPAAALRRWRFDVRDGITTALDAGHAGVAVERDDRARRAWVGFSPR